jgi:hypothetical protein
MCGPFTFVEDAIMICGSIYVPFSQYGIGIQDGTNRKEENAEI